MKCAICKKEVSSVRTALKNGKYVSARCDSCLANFSQFAVYARKYNRDRDREDHRKDIIQRFDGDKINPEFVRAYPDISREQFGDDVLRTHG